MTRTKTAVKAEVPESARATSDGQPLTTEPLAREGEPSPPAVPSCAMKFTAGRDELLKVLTQVVKAASMNSAMEVLSQVLLTTRPCNGTGMPAHVELTCSNTEFSISWLCKATIACEGAFTVPAKTLLECVRTFSKGKRVTLEVVEPQVHVQSGKRTFKLKGGMQAGEFPAWCEMLIDDGAPILLDTDVFRQAIKEVQIAASDDEAQPLLSTVCFQVEREQRTLVLAALDGYRMAVRNMAIRMPVRSDASLLIPAPSMRLLAEVLPPECPVTTVLWDGETPQAVFRAGPAQIMLRLREGTFPNYRALLPKTNTVSFTIPRGELEHIVKAFKLFAQDNRNIFRLFYNEERGTVGCQAESEELGEAYDEIKVPVEGSEGLIIFNIRYLMDVLNKVPGEAFVFLLSKKNRPALITPQGRQDYAHVVMPMSSNR